uniref:Uncharacterized protein n=1 Tax=Prolemur simus TaxID=1328070 RepID=A0A8C9AGN4_PROSS
HLQDAWQEVYVLPGHTVPPSSHKTTFCAASQLFAIILPRNRLSPFPQIRNTTTSAFLSGPKSPLSLSHYFGQGDSRAERRRGSS